MSVGIQLEDMANMEYASCDYSNNEDVYAGKTKVIKISKTTTSIASNGSMAMINYFVNPFSVKFDHTYKGLYSLYRVDGTLLENGSFVTNSVLFNTNQKGSYIINLMIEGQKKPIIKKFLVK